MEVCRRDAGLEVLMEEGEGGQRKGSTGLLRTAVPQNIGEPEQGCSTRHTIAN